MAIETWLAFAAAATLPPPIPGPTVQQTGRHSGAVRRLLNGGGGVPIGAGIATPATRRG
jgi:hypothetical protein